MELVQGNSVVRLLPADRWTLDVTIDFANPVIGRERIVIDLTARGFSSELAAARTFGFAHEVEQMRAAGLGRGGSLDNAVVVERDRTSSTRSRQTDPRSSSSMIRLSPHKSPEISGHTSRIRTKSRPSSRATTCTSRRPSAARSSY